MPLLIVIITLPEEEKGNDSIWVRRKGLEVDVSSGSIAQVPTQDDSKFPGGRGL